MTATQRKVDAPYLNCQIDDLPIAYGLILDAPSLKDPIYEHGMTLLFNTLDKPGVGALCVVHSKDGRANMIYIESSVDDFVDQLPLTEHPNSTVLTGFFGRVLGTDETRFICADKVAAIHKCDGWLSPDVVIT